MQVISKQQQNDFRLDRIAGETHPAPGISSAMTRPVQRSTQAAKVNTRRITKGEIGRLI